MEQIDGLEIYPNVISELCHDQLIKYINMKRWNVQLSRKTQHYGYRYDYSTRALYPCEKIPNYLERLIDIMMENEYFDERPDQIIINRYLPNEGISPHIDHKVLFAGQIVTLSLGEDCQYQMTKDGETINVQVNKRSLVSLKYEARNDWMHSLKMPSLKENPKCKIRYSITFRKVVNNNNIQ